MRKRRIRRIREMYEEYKGARIKEGCELHHKVPIFAGGTNDMENLIEVTPDEHAKLHLERYEEFGDFRDLCAYHMIGYNFTEAHRISSSEGGKVGGKKVYENGNGIFRSEEERLLWSSMGGTAAQKTLKEKQISAFYDPELRKEICSKGGKNGAFTKPEIQSELGKRGGKGNTGFVWITDGKNNIKYTKKSQKEMSVEEFLKINPQYSIGFIQETVECPHCMKSGNKPAMVRHHFNNCKKKEKR